MPKLDVFAIFGQSFTESYTIREVSERLRKPLDLLSWSFKHYELYMTKNVVGKQDWIF